MAGNRLSIDDVSNLALEAPDTLMHQAAVAVLDADLLLDPEGHVRIDLVRRFLESKLSGAPELRRVLRPTRQFQGRPLWVDDPGFRIENHVHAGSLPDPGGEAALLKFVEHTTAEQMDRALPLWQLWLLDGYAPGRVALVIKVHHALVDGPGMLNLVGQLFDQEPRRSPLGPGGWAPQPPPTNMALVAGSFERAAADIAHAGRILLHPWKLARSAAATAAASIETMRQARGAPVTSLNRPIGVARRVAVCRLSLPDVKEAAHTAGAKVNDVFLNLVAGGLRAVLLSRGEPVSGVSLHASIAVSMHPAGDSAMHGNDVGTLVVALPLGEADPAVRLGMIAAATAVAKSRQRPVVTPALMALLTRTGMTRRYIRRQRMISVLTTNMHGPERPLYLSGARMREVFAAPPIAGNVSASFAALSYGDEFNISVVADAASWPDLDVLMAALNASWRDLRRPSMVPLAAGL